MSNTLSDICVKRYQVALSSSAPTLPPKVNFRESHQREVARTPLPQRFAHRGRASVQAPKPLPEWGSLLQRTSENASSRRRLVDRHLAEALSFAVWPHSGGVKGMCPAG